MSDSEDDYMSDKLLTACESANIRPGLLFNNKQKRTHELYKKQNEEQTVKKPRTYREQEKELRNKGLNTAISSENIGFKMLEKMGYKAGSSLGKTDEGIKEPVAVIVKETASGVGREQHVKDIIMKKQSLKKVDLMLREKEFRAANIEKSLMFMLKNDYYKAQRICEELDSRNVVDEPLEDFFWTKSTVNKLRMVRANQEDNENLRDQEEEEEEEEQEEEITEQKLQLIIDYLRETYLYCMYCAITGTDAEDLQANCPGPYRIDHEDSM